MRWMKTTTNNQQQLDIQEPPTKLSIWHCHIHRNDFVCFVLFCFALSWNRRIWCRCSAALDRWRRSRCSADRWNSPFYRWYENRAPRSPVVVVCAHVPCLAAVVMVVVAAAATPAAAAAAFFCHNGKTYKKSSTLRSRFQVFRMPFPCLSACSWYGEWMFYAGILWTIVNRTHGIHKNLYI